MMKVTDGVRRGSLAPRLALFRQTLSVLANRTVSEANLPFITSRIELVQRLGSGLDREFEQFHGLSSHLSPLTLHNFRELSARVLAQLPAPEEPAGGFVRMAAHRPIKPADFDRIAVLFSPEIGIGDELTFYQLLAKFPVDRCEIWSTIPQIWRRLGFERAKSYCSVPDEPFQRIEASPHPDRLLVLHIGFLDGAFVQSAYRTYSSSTLVQVTLANHSIMAWSGGRAVQFYRSPIDCPNNYEFVLEASRAFFDLDRERLPVYEVYRPKPERPTDAVVRLLINPLTSKRMLLSPSDWVEFVSALGGSEQHPGRYRCTVLAGFSPATVRYAEEIVQGLRSRLPGIEADCLRDERGELAGIDNAMDLVLDRMRETDLMLGIDTYTAHLAPLFGIPSYALFYNDRNGFRVPASDAYALTLRRGLPDLIRAASALFAFADGSAPPREANVDGQRIDEIVSLTDRLKSRMEQGALDSPEASTDFRTLLGAKEDIRAALGKANYAALTHICGRPDIFDVSIDEDDLPIGDSRRRLLFNWVSSSVCHVLIKLAEAPQ